MWTMIKVEKLKLLGYIDSPPSQYTNFWLDKKLVSEPRFSKVSSLTSWEKDQDF